MIPTTSILHHLKSLQQEIRRALIASRSRQNLHEVSHDTAADTIYQIDTEVEPILDEFCTSWAKETPLVLIAEGLEDDAGNEAVKVYPAGTREEDAAIRVIVDPIDGTRGIMYDKRPAWALAGVAPNFGAKTRLRDIQVAVMTELPTSKMGFSDVLWAVKGQGAHGERVNLTDQSTTPLTLAPSRSHTIAHGFASVSNFFPGTKVLASELMERIAAQLLGQTDFTKAAVFDDQYICTGGQFYELILGHDRFNADLRPLLYRCISSTAQGLCVHPYDVATALVAEEAGVILTDGLGNPLDGPLDCTTGLSWAGYANEALHRQIEPIIQQFFHERGVG